MEVEYDAIQTLLGFTDLCAMAGNDFSQSAKLEAFQGFNVMHVQYLPNSQDQSQINFAQPFPQTRSPSPPRNLTAVLTALSYSGTNAEALRNQRSS